MSSIVSRAFNKTARLFSAFRRDGFGQLVARRFKGVARFRKADLIAGVGKNAWRNRSQRGFDFGVQPQLARHRQVQVILQPAPQIRELHGGDRPGDAAILFRVQPIFTRIEQNAVAVGEVSIVDGFVRLAALVEGDRVRPGILIALALLLRIVPPVYAVPLKVDFDAVLEAGPRNDARVSRGRVNQKRADGRASAVVRPVLPPFGALVLRLPDVEPQSARVPNVNRAVQFLDVIVRDHRAQRASGAGVAVNVVGELANVSELPWRGFVRQVKKRDGSWQALFQKGHPLVGLAPCAGAVIKLLARPIKRRGNDAIADAFARPFVAVRGGEIRAAEASRRSLDGLDAVGLNQLNSITMREAVILGVEIAALIKFRLTGFVINHRGQTVFVRQSEIEQLQFNGDDRLFAVGLHRDLTAIRAGGKIARRINFNPDGLILAPRDGERKAAPTGVFRHELNGFPADRVRRFGGGGFVKPARARGLCDVEVIDRE